MTTSLKPDQAIDLSSDAADAGADPTPTVGVRRRLAERDWDASPEGPTVSVASWLGEVRGRAASTNETDLREVYESVADAVATGARRQNEAAQLAAAGALSIGVLLGAGWLASLAAAGGAGAEEASAHAQRQIGIGVETADVPLAAEPSGGDAD